MQGALDLAPDVTVGGRYRLLEPLARGATASVWRAVDTAGGREVAIKVLRDDGVDPALRRRAEREASVLTGISHPNLVEVLDSGHDGDGRPYLVMALLEGDPLDRVIADRAPLPHEEAVTLVADVADGLGVAHDHGVVHRDVKPGNIVCHDQVPTVVDFGIARAIDATTMTRGLVVGTASYLAPEQAQGLSITPAADVYSLACVLYELLTGHPPFDGDTPVTIAVKHVQAEPTPPGDLVELPAAIDAAVMRALAKDPGTRPSDGHAFATELRAALASDTADETVAIAAPVVTDGTTVMPAVVVPPPRVRERRSVPPFVLVAGAVVIVLALLALALDGGQDDARTVPDVTNANVADATRYLEGAGLRVEVVDVAADAPAGTVVASDPGAGDRIAADGTVQLSVSSGPPVAPTTTVAPEPERAPARGKGKHKDDD